MVPVFQQVIRVMADVTAAIARSGARAHPGNLVLAWVTSNVQQARPAPAWLHLDKQRRRCSPSSATRASAVSRHREEGNSALSVCKPACLCV